MTSSARILCCACLVFAIRGQHNSSYDMSTDRRLFLPLLAVEVPVLLEMFGTGTVVAEGVAAASAEGAAALVEGGVALVEGGAAFVEEAAITIEDLAGVTIALAEEAFFVVSEEAVEIVTGLLEKDAQGAVTLTTDGAQVAAEVAKSPSELAAAAVGDVGEVLSSGQLAASDEAGTLGKEFVEGGGKLLQGDKVQATAAAGTARMLQDSSEKAQEFLQWTLTGMSKGFVGGRCQDAVKPLMKSAKAMRKFTVPHGMPVGPVHTLAGRDTACLWLMGLVAMGIAIVTATVRRQLKEPCSYAAEDIQPLTERGIAVE